MNKMKNIIIFNIRNYGNIIIKVIMLYIKIMYSLFLISLLYLFFYFVSY